MHIELMNRLAAAEVPVTCLEHSPEGNTVLASRLRGHSLRAAAKSIVIRVAMSKRKGKYVVGVVCGHKRVDLSAVARCYGGRAAHFADHEVSARLTGCVSGSVVPISFDSSLSLIADFEILTLKHIYFNSGRLDHSIKIPVKHWLALASPRMDKISEDE